MRTSAPRMIPTITAGRSAGSAGKATIGLEGLVNEAGVDVEERDEVGVNVEDAMGTEEIEEVVSTLTLPKANAVVVGGGT